MGTLFVALCVVAAVALLFAYRGMSKPVPPANENFNPAPFKYTSYKK